ncbi:hypothetical protein SAMN02745174_02608 [Cetobacterium ceti]|uniref:Uncharacterized protein n=1 Tax=Cetobacterium ceti TaxID=180163 RepID=A0A1T4R867_9FUSO|nr:hypothetical protein [Cetobacterium ceti]SKA12006.1 hypothetical protein SAMN02745174_02608 [Cetobacterium ceti]
MNKLEMIIPKENGKYTYIDDNTVIEKLDKIFIDKKYNKSCLKSAKNILKQYLRDTRVRDLIENNLPKFLKSTVENNEEALKILDDKISDEIQDEESLEVDLKKLLEI